LIEEPSRLLELIKTNFDKVKFEEGKLIVPFVIDTQLKDISILLFKDPSYPIATKNKADIKQL
jgi:hypothetical protein